MSNFLQHISKFKEQILYLIFGVLTTAVNFITYFYLCYIDVPYKISNALAILLSIVFAYITNKIWVFNSKSSSFLALILELFKFISLRFVSAIFDMLSMIILIDFLYTSNLLAKILTAFIVVLLNYVFSKMFVFKKSTEKNTAISTKEESSMLNENNINSIQVSTFKNNPDLELISISVPCYNEELSLPFFYKEFVKLAENMKNLVNFEVIFINDGSKDNTFNSLKVLHKNDDRIKYISFSRNFGKESAMFAGLEKAIGEYLVIMDADLQHPPEMIMEMYDGIINEGYDCVATRRISRDGEPKIRSFFAEQFYKIMNGACDYRLMKRQVANSILELKEYNRFTKGIFAFVGYDTKWLPYKNTERIAGETTWSFWGLFKYSLEGITAFSTAPLYLASLLGFVICIFSFIFMMFTVWKTVMFGEVVDGYPTLICVVTFLGGIQLFSVGILGQYIGKLYLEAKKRPIYIIKDET